MRLKYDFSVVDIDDKKLAVPIGDNAGELHCVLSLNETGAAILDLLMQGDDEATIVNKLRQQYDDDPSIPEYVHTFLEELVAGGVLA